MLSIYSSPQNSCSQLIPFFNLAIGSHNLVRLHIQVSKAENWQAPMVPNNPIHSQHSIDGDNCDWDNLLPRFGYGEMESVENRQCLALSTMDTILSTLRWVHRVKFVRNESIYSGKGKGTTSDLSKFFSNSILSCEIQVTHSRKLCPNNFSNACNIVRTPTRGVQCCTSTTPS